MTISSEAQLRTLYELPKGRAKVKVLKTLESHSRNFINSSPFVVLSTVSKNHQMDASPRGGYPGFVKISNDKELLIPDYKGNNRVDSLSNIVETGSIGLLFFIPGIDETLRVNGTATVTTSEDLLAKCTSDSKVPISCIVVSIEEVFLHCAKAFMRSKLWKVESQTDPSGFPSLGKMLNDQLEEGGNEETREEMIKRYQKDI
jgi:PPOX class probable FMN-dependent enzyme